MDAIYRAVTSPEWWFTAVFVAVCSGIFSAWLKDKLSALLARMSLKFSRYRAEKIARRDAEVAFYASSAQMLVLEHIMLVRRLVWCVFYAGATIGLPAIASIMDTSPLFVRVRDHLDDAGMIFRYYQVGLLFLAMLACIGLAVSAFSLQSRDELCRRARLRAAENAARAHQLPPV